MQMPIMVITLRGIFGSVANDAREISKSGKLYGAEDNCRGKKSFNVGVAKCLLTVYTATIPLWVQHVSCISNLAQGLILKDS